MDLYQRFDSMETDKLATEIQTLNKKLFKMKPNTSMYNQMLGVIVMAQGIYSDRLMLERMPDSESSRVFDIGEIETHNGQPNYGESILQVVVDSYLTKPRRSE
jgi:hypothetical protein